MVLTKAAYKMKKTGIPLADFNRNYGEQPPVKRKPQFIPAEQVALVELLSDILEQLKKIEENTRPK